MKAQALKTAGWLLAPIGFAVVANINAARTHDWAFAMALDLVYAAALAAVVGGRIIHGRRGKHG
jgi:hypothetical protein